MRNLTIKREKRFVACLGTMKVYIEDPSANDLTINGCACRKLGTLKNGQEKTFVISESAAKVFIIADKLSKGYCSEYYPLPEGTEDVVLTGRNRFNLAAGNAFRFDGVTDEEVLANRKKGTRKGVLVLLVAVIIGFVCGFVATSGILGKVEPKTFTESDFEITLTDKFRPSSAENYTYSYASKDVAVLILKEGRTAFESVGIDSLTEYADAVQLANGHDAPIQKDEGYLYYEYQYTNPNTGVTYHYITTMHKGAFNFWIVQFVIEEENTEEYRETVLEWARSVQAN